MGISDKVKLLKQAVVLPTHLGSLDTMSVHTQSYHSQLPRQNNFNKRIGITQQTFGDKVQQ